MFFDSENVPLVTRIESGPGVTISFVVNSYGEGVYKARIDSDHIVGTVNKSFTFDVSSLSDISNRLTQMETLLGINAPPPSLPNVQDSEGLGVIVYAQSNAVALAGQLRFRWRLLSFDRNEIASMRITISAGTLADNVLRTLLYTIKQNSLVSNYLEDIRVDDSPTSVTKLVFKFKPGFERMHFDIVDVINSVPADASRFVSYPQIR